MFAADYSTKFKKDLKLMEKRGHDMSKIFYVMLQLRDEAPLSPLHRDHALLGNYKGFRECHVEPDWLLIYKINELKREILFARTGSHSDLFER